MKCWNDVFSNIAPRTSIWWRIAYRGREIQTAILNFFDATAGISWEQITVKDGPLNVTLAIRGGSNLLAYIGHDGLMDFKLPRLSRQKNDTPRQAIILACASKIYFAGPLRTSGAYPYSGRPT